MRPAFLAALAAFASFMAHPTVLAQEIGALRAASLRTEARTNPFGVDVARPRLSWQLASDASDQRQTAFQVLVAGSRAAIDEDRGDVWDSGKLDGARTFGIEYAGPALRAHQACFWKVRVWDRGGRPSAYSDPATWTVGILDPADWNDASWIGYDRHRDPAAPVADLGAARWIAQAGADPMNAPQGHRLFAAAPRLPEALAVGRAELVVLADNRASCVLNGATLFVDRAGWQDATPLDVTGIVRAGQNDLRIQVENESDGPTGLLALLRIETADGEELVVATDATWTAGAPYPDWHQGPLQTRGFAPVQVIGGYGIAPWGTARSARLKLPPVPQLRTSFTIDAPVRRALLYGTALGSVDFRLNGAPVADERFTPGWTDYRIRVPYRTWDVTARVRQGENVLGALLADGWYSGHVGWGQKRDHYGERPRLRALLRIEFADGTVRTVASDAEWRGAIGAILEADFLMGERCDARLAIAGWDAPDLDTSGWDRVDVGAEMDPAIGWHPAPPVEAIGEFAPVAITEPTPGCYVFDLGQNFAGFARLRVKGERGREITLRFAERLNPDGTIYTTNLRGARATDVYVCRGDGDEVWEPRFTFHGFQYVAVTGLGRAPTKATVTGVALSSQTARVGSFECSEPMLNRLWTNVLWTQRSNFIEVPTDCPQRDERLGWTGDAQVYVRTATLNSDVQSFFAKWLVDLADAQRADGQLPMVAPLIVAGGDGGPAWSDAGTIVPWAIWEVYGDRVVLERQYPSMVRYVEFCERRSIDGVLPPKEFHCFGDWLSIDAPTPNELIYTAYYAHSVDLTRRAAEVLGRTDDAARFAALHARIRDAFAATFFGEDGKVVNDTQCGYVLALAYDLVDGEQRDRAAANLVANIEARDNHLSTGFIGTKDLMLVLSKIGRSDVAYRLLLNDTFPSWGFSIRHGATSIWERWDGWTPEKGFQDPGMNSFAHYSFGAVYQWMVENIGGIRMTDVAYGKVAIAPLPGGGLTWANTEYESVRGRFVTEWRLDGDTFALDVQIPPNVDATVTIPTSDPRSVREAGQEPVARGLEVIATDAAGVTFRVPSGSWSFRAARL